MTNGSFCTRQLCRFYSGRSALLISLKFLEILHIYCISLILYEKNQIPVFKNVDLIFLGCAHFFEFFLTVLKMY
jgi:hypothetical protein